MTFAFWIWTEVVDPHAKVPLPIAGPLQPLPSASVFGFPLLLFSFSPSLFLSLYTRIVRAVSLAIACVEPKPPRGIAGCAKKPLMAWTITACGELWRRALIFVRGPGRFLTLLRFLPG